MRVTVRIAVDHYGNGARCLLRKFKKNCRRGAALIHDSADPVAAARPRFRWTIVKDIISLDMPRDPFLERIA